MGEVKSDYYGMMFLWEGDEKILELDSRIAAQFFECTKNY
jgi:hypothetical protein